MDVVLVVLAAVCILIGIAGCILPVLPGVPLAYVGLLLLHASSYADFSLTFLLLWGAAVVVVQLLDYFIPAWGAKRFGGTKWGIWGSTIGVLVGIFLGPWGIVLGPFIGAVIGENRLVQAQRQPIVERGVVASRRLVGLILPSEILA